MEQNPGIRLDYELGQIINNVGNEEITVTVICFLLQGEQNIM